jgi:branched-chain amino acid transport system permease protein
VTTVTISSVLSLMLVGVLLVVFVALAPRGIVGVWKSLRERRA